MPLLFLDRRRVEEPQRSLAAGRWQPLLKIRKSSWLRLLYRGLSLSVALGLCCLWGSSGHFARVVDYCCCCCNSILLLSFPLHIQGRGPTTFNPSFHLFLCSVVHSLSTPASDPSTSISIRLREAQTSIAQTSKPPAASNITPPGPGPAVLLVESSRRMHGHLCRFRLSLSLQVLISAQ